jgi:hypothetical protein
MNFVGKLHMHLMHLPICHQSMRPGHYDMALTCEINDLMAELGQPPAYPEIEALTSAAEPADFTEAQFFAWQDNAMKGVRSSNSNGSSDIGTACMRTCR